MPVRFFTEAERERLTRFPSEITPDDVNTYFTLAGDDLAAVQTQRGSHNQIGFALQLGTLRYLGFCPDDLHAAPAAVVAYLAQQLAVEPQVLTAYAERAQTRTDHFQKVQAHLGYREATPADLDTLASWLVERALEHDKPSLLFGLAAEKLRADKVVRPGVTRLERLVASVRERAQHEIFVRLTPLLTDERRRLLAELLVQDESLQHTRLDWLRQRATTTSPRAILKALEQLTWLRNHGVDHWDLSWLTPNRRKFLAQLGHKSSAQTLIRMPVERRCPILLAFLVQTVEDITDEVVDLFINYLGLAHRRAGRTLDRFRQRTAKATNEKVRLCQQLGSLILDSAIADPQLRAAIFQQVPRAKLQEAVEECAQLARPLDDHYFDFLAQHYSMMRSFAPAFLTVLAFEANSTSQPLLEAINLLRRLDRDKLKAVPAETSLTFIPAKWESYVVDGRGLISRRYYELCVLWQLREALRAGNIWVVGSRRYANPDSYLIPPERWQTLRADVCQLLQMPLDGTQRLDQYRAELAQWLTKLDSGLTGEAPMRIVDERLQLTLLSRPSTCPRVPYSCSSGSRSVCQQSNWRTC